MIDREWRRRLLAPALGLSLTALLIAGCASAGIPGGGTSGGGVPASSATAGTGLSGGEPSPCDGAPAVTPITPTATLRWTDASKTVSAPVGSIVEIRLDGQHVWRAGSILPEGALVRVGAQNALEHGDCVSDFRIAQAGDATVTFTGTALCKAGQACPQYALLAEFHVVGS